MEINDIFERLKLHHPNPKTELEYSDNFSLLIAVILSARCTDKAVNRATRPLFELYNTPELLLELGVEALQEYIKSLGMYITKSKNIIKTCRILVDDYGSNVPDNMEQLTSLPGVGRKTANVVLNVAFGLPTIPVDTHVMRVSQRLGLAKSDKPDKIEQELLAILPEVYLQQAHHVLVLHGRYICKSQNPKCYECNLTKYCKYYAKSNV